MDAHAVAKLVKKYISIWNQTDDHLRRTLIDEVFTPDAVYEDPTIVAGGVGAIDANIAGAQKHFNGMRFTHGTILAHHDAVHFSWEVGPAGGDPVSSGYDTVLMRGNQFHRVYGFFNER